MAELTEGDSGDEPYEALDRMSLEELDAIIDAYNERRAQEELEVPEA